MLDEIEEKVRSTSLQRKALNQKHTYRLQNVEMEMERLCELALKSARSQLSTGTA
jgi:hypothetical protein